MIHARIEATFTNGTGEVHVRITGQTIIKYDHTESFVEECDLEPGNWILTLTGYANASFEFKITDSATHKVLAAKTVDGPAQIGENSIFSV